MKKYHDLLRLVLAEGIDKGDRTGTGTRSLFGVQYEHDLSEGFPLLTTKKIHIKSVIHELLWFLSGSTNIKYLKDNGVSIWDEWATETGELGPVYGSQWRNWKASNGTSIDQVAELMKSLEKNPNSRRHIINGWNVADLPDESISPVENARQGKMALPPCHVLYQFYVGNGKLSCQLYQRSGDLFLGIPFNLASVSFLVHMMAQQLNLQPGRVIHTIGDLHIYQNHMEQVQTQLARDFRALPTLRFARKPQDIFSYTFDDFIIEGYDPHPGIKAPIAI